jgi:hypothetical protein
MQEECKKSKLDVEKMKDVERRWIVTRSGCHGHVGVIKRSTVTLNAFNLKFE